MKDEEIRKVAEKIARELVRPCDFTPEDTETVLAALRPLASKARDEATGEWVAILAPLFHNIDPAKYGHALALPDAALYQVMHQLKVEQYRELLRLYVRSLKSGSVEG